MCTSCKSLAELTMIDVCVLDHQTDESCVVGRGQSPVLVPASQLVWGGVKVSRDQGKVASHL